MIVLDASAAIDIVRGTPEGLGFLELAKPDEPIIAPRLFAAETANTLRTLAHAGHMDQADALSKLGEALDLVDEFVNDEELLPEALCEAMVRGLPAYDMFYLVLARRRHATLFTADRALAALCEAAGVDCVLFAES